MGSGGKRNGEVARAAGATGEKAERRDENRERGNRRFWVLKVLGLIYYMYYIK